MSMSPADIVATTSGVSEAMSLFFTIGGAVLIVGAAVWGFKRVKGVLVDSGGHSSLQGEGDDQKNEQLADWYNSGGKRGSQR